MQAVGGRSTEAEGAAGGSGAAVGPPLHQNHMSHLCRTSKGEREISEMTGGDQGCTGPPAFTRSGVGAEICWGNAGPPLHCLPVWLRASTSSMSHQPPPFRSPEGMGTDTGKWDCGRPGGNVLLFFKTKLSLPPACHCSREEAGPLPQFPQHGTYWGAAWSSCR